MTYALQGKVPDKGYIAMLRSYPERDTTLILLSNTYRATPGEAYGGGASSMTVAWVA